MSNSVSKISGALGQASKKVQEYGDFATVRDRVTSVLLRFQETARQLVATFRANMTTAGEAPKSDEVTSTGINPGE